MAGPGVPGLRPRGAFFTDTSESESESDLVMSAVALPISRSESSLESESDPDSTFCSREQGWDAGWLWGGSAPIPAILPNLDPSIPSPSRPPRDQ